MSAQESIIDINPVASMRDKAKDATKTVTDNVFRAPSYSRSEAKSAPHTPPTASVVEATVMGQSSTTEKPSRLSGIVQVVAGGLLMLIGIPMLILPGPGLLAIGGGAALAVRGIKRLLGKNC